MVVEINKAVKGIGIILFLGFTIGYIIPFSLSLRSKGMDKKEVFNIIETNLNAAGSFKSKDLTSEDSLNILRYHCANMHNDAIDSEIALLGQKSASAANFKETVIKLNHEKMDNEKIPGIKVFGFLDSRTSFVMPISFTALLILCSIILPVKPKINRLQFSLIFALVAIMYITPQIIRASLLGTDDRVIYSVYNRDVNPAMFFYNLGLNITIIFILVLVWYKCASYANENKREYNSDFTLYSVIDTLTNIKKSYITWQFFSVALFAVFGTQLYNFYSNVFADGDKRYLFQAIFLNFIYLHTWIIGTIPLYYEFGKWRSFKDKLLFDVDTEKKMEKNGINVAELRKILPDYEMTSSLNHTVTVILSIFSILIPLIQPILKIFRL